MKIYVLTQSTRDDREEGCPAYFEPIKAFYREADAVAWRDDILASWKTWTPMSKLHFPLSAAHFEITAVELE